jgi:hypothetical protein
MNYSPHSRTIGVALGICVAVVCLCLAGTGIAAAQSADIVVATDGSGDYTSIQNAVDNATDGDHIKVEPGTYEQHTEISKNITVYAPNGATIANTSAVVSNYGRFDVRSGFQIFGEATPTISGFTLTDWRWAISAGGSEGGWTVKDTEIIGGNCGVCAAGTPGDWTVKNVEITNAEPAVSGVSSSGAWSITNTTIQGGKVTLDDATGNWTVRNSEFRNSSDDGIDAVNNRGQWTIENVTIENVGAIGIDAGDTNATHAPVIRDTTVVGTSEEGIDIADSKSNVLITGSTVRNTGPGEYKNGIRIEESVGNWTIEDTTIENISGEGIDVFNQPESSHATLRNLTVTDTQKAGVNFFNSSGNWEIINSHISNTDDTGVVAGHTTGDWSITSSTVETTKYDLIWAYEAAGNWEIHESKLSTGGVAINATEAVKGNASHNYWGATDGPSGDFNGSGGAAVGNLTVTPYYVDASLTTLSSEQGSGSGGLPTNPGEPGFGDVLEVIQSFNTNSEYADTGVTPGFSDVLEVIQAFNAG